MKFKLLLCSLLMSCGILSAQDTIWSLVITEARLDRADEAYIELTNMGEETINLANFTFGTVSPWSPDPANYTAEYTGDTMKLPNYELAPGETYLIAAFRDYNLEKYYEEVAKFEYSPHGYTVFKPEMWKLADLQIHGAESPVSDPTDSVSTYAGTMDVWNGRDCWYIRQHISATDSVVIDQVGGVFTEANGNNPDSPADVAGVTGATGNSVLVRKYSITHGNLDFRNARGNDLNESEWMPVPFLSGQWEPDRAIFWTVGNHGDYNLDASTLVSETIGIDGWNKILTVPWGVRRDDSIMYQFNRVPGLAWHYNYHHDTLDPEQSHEDSAFVSCRTGDMFTVYACGTDLDRIDFEIVVSDPTPDANIVVPKRVLQLDGTFVDTYTPYRVSDGIPGMDTISEVPYGTRVDTLLKYLEKAPNASWEIVWVDGVERADLKKGDILRVTAENGTSVKDYFIKVLRYRQSQNAYLASITWPDIPEDYWNYYGWLQDTIPNFIAGGYNYKVQVPYDVEGIPALVAKAQDVNAKIEVSRAVNLSGSTADKTVTFTVTAECDTMSHVYAVQLEKEKNPADVQPWSAEPIISEFIFWEMWSNGMVEICNPGNQVLDLSNYMFFGGWSTSPSDAITWYAEPEVATWKNRYVKYIPGRQWVDSSQWKVTPAILKTEADLSVKPQVQPGDVFLMTFIATDWGIYGTDYETNWPATKQADVLFNYPGRTNQWGEVNDVVGECCVRQWTGADFYVYKIVGDSVREGLKPATDPNDFELIETFGQADGSSWKPVGEPPIDMITTCIRKPEYYLPTPGFDTLGSFGTTPENSQWMIMNQAYFDARNAGWPMDILLVVQDLGKHFMNEVTIFKSTVASTVYKVSSGYSMDETIRGVVEGTTVDEFLGGIIKANEDQSLTCKHGDTELGGSDVLLDEDVLVVLSADSVNTSQYVLDVTAGGLSDDALLTSDVYDITATGAEGAVAGMDYGTTLAEVLDNVTVPVTASMMVIDANGAYQPLKRLNFDTLYLDVTVSDQIFLEVVAEDGVTKITYQLQPVALSSDAFVTSELFPVVQDSSLIKLVPYGMTVDVFLANVYPVTGATMVLKDKNGIQRVDGEIYRDDKLVVTSEDGTATKIYYLQMLPVNSGDQLLHLAYVMSDVYDVNQVAMTISGFHKITVAELSGNLVASSGASFVVVNADGNVNSGTLNLVGDKVVVTAQDGVTIANYEVLVSTVSIDNSVISPVEIYPNPTAGMLNITGLERGNRIRVYNSIGVGLIDMVANQNHEVISLEGNPAGIYFIMVSKADSVVGRYKVILK